jgi:hypothetical protein
MPIPHQIISKIIKMKKNISHTKKAISIFTGA